MSVSLPPSSSTSPAWSTASSVNLPNEMAEDGQPPPLGSSSPILHHPNASPTPSNGEFVAAMGGPAAAASPPSQPQPQLPASTARQPTPAPPPRPRPLAAQGAAAAKAQQQSVLKRVVKIMLDRLNKEEEEEMKQKQSQEPGQRQVQQLQQQQQQMFSLQQGVPLVLQQQLSIYNYSTTNAMYGVGASSSGMAPLPQPPPAAVFYPQSMGYNPAQHLVPNTMGRGPLVNSTGNNSSLAIGQSFLPGGYGVWQQQQLPISPIVSLANCCYTSVASMPFTFQPQSTSTPTCSSSRQRPSTVIRPPSQISQLRSQQLQQPIQPPTTTVAATETYPQSTSSHSQQALSRKGEVVATTSTAVPVVDDSQVVNDPPSTHPNDNSEAAPLSALEQPPPNKQQQQQELVPGKETPGSSPSSTPAMEELASRANSAVDNTPPAHASTAVANPSITRSVEGSRPATTYSSPMRREAILRSAVTAAAAAPPGHSTPYSTLLRSPTTNTTPTSAIRPPAVLDSPVHSEGSSSSSGESRIRWASTACTFGGVNLNQPCIDPNFLAYCDTVTSGCDVSPARTAPTTPLRMSIAPPRAASVPREIPLNPTRPSDQQAAISQNSNDGYKCEGGEQEGAEETETEGFMTHYRYPISIGKKISVVRAVYQPGYKPSPSKSRRKRWGKEKRRPPSTPSTSNASKGEGAGTSATEVKKEKRLLCATKSTPEKKRNTAGGEMGLRHFPETSTSPLRRSIREKNARTILDPSSLPRTADSMSRTSSAMSMEKPASPEAGPSTSSSTAQDPVHHSTTSAKSLLQANGFRGVRVYLFDQDPQLLRTFGHGFRSLMREIRWQCRGRELKEQRKEADKKQRRLSTLRRVKLEYLGDAGGKEEKEDNVPAAAGGGSDDRCPMRASRVRIYSEGEEPAAEGGRGSDDESPIVKRMRIDSDDDESEEDTADSGDVDASGSSYDDDELKLSSTSNSSTQHEVQQPDELDEPEPMDWCGPPDNSDNEEFINNQTPSGAASSRLLEEQRPSSSGSGRQALQLSSSTQASSSSATSKSTATATLSPASLATRSRGRRLLEPQPEDVVCTERVEEEEGVEEGDNGGVRLCDRMMRQSLLYEHTVRVHNTFIGGWNLKGTRDTLERQSPEAIKQLKYKCLPCDRLLPSIEEWFKHNTLCPNQTISKAEKRRRAARNQASFREKMVDIINSALAKIAEAEDEAARLNKLANSLFQARPWKKDNNHVEGCSSSTSFHAQ